MAYCVQWGITNSSYADDFGVIEFENASSFEDKVHELLEESNRVDHVGNLPPGYCVRFYDGGDLVEITVVDREASPSDLSDLRCENGHMLGLDECDCEDAPTYWIEEIAGRKYVVHEEWYLRPDED